MALKSITPVVYDREEYEINYTEISFDLDSMEEYRTSHGYKKTGNSSYLNSKIDDYLLQHLYDYVKAESKVTTKGFYRVGNGVVIYENGYILTWTKVVRFYNINDAAKEIRQEVKDKFLNIAQQLDAFFDFENEVFYANDYRIKEFEKAERELYSSLLQADEEDGLADIIDALVVFDTETLKSIDGTPMKSFFYNYFSARVELYEELIKEEPELDFLFDVKLKSQDISVLFPTPDGDTDWDSATEYKAELVQSGTNVPTRFSVIKITNTEEEFLALPVSKEYPQKNSNLWTVSLQDDSLTSIDNVVKRLTVEDFSEVQNSKYIILTNKITNNGYGHYGSPVINDNLELVGIISGDSNSNTGVCALADFISELEEFKPVSKENFYFLRTFDREEGFIESDLTQRHTVTEGFIKALECWQRKDYEVANLYLSCLRQTNYKIPFVNTYIAEFAPEVELIKLKRELRQKEIDEQRERENKKHIIIFVFSLILLFSVIIGGIIVYKKKDVILKKLTDLIHKTKE